MATKQKRALEVWKFGGASLADVSAIARAVDLIKRHQGPLVIVASALGGITDLLLEGAAAATSGRSADAGRAAAVFLRRHRDVARALIPAGPARRRLLVTIETAAREYRELCIAIGVLGHLAPRASDLLVSRGERLSAQIVAAALSRSRRRAAYVDSAEVVVTDGHHGGAAPNIAATARLARRRIRPLLDAGTIAVVPGFIGRAPDGSVTTLGRGGSDLTATLLARALGAIAGRAVEGRARDPDRRSAAGHRRAADPAAPSSRGGRGRPLRRQGPAPARAHPHRRHAHHAARPIVHPHRAAGHGGVGQTLGHDLSGQGASRSCAARRSSPSPARAWSASTASRRARSWPSTRSGCRSRPSSRRPPKARSASRCPRARPTAPSRACARRFATSCPPASSTTSPRVLGWRSSRSSATAWPARRASRRASSTALSTGGINVVAIAQGSSERNISFAVTTDQATEAARRVHSAFQLSKIGGGRAPAAPRTDVVLLGFGRVGRALADQIGAASGRGQVRVVGLLDRSGYIFEPRGISRRRLHGAGAREGRAASCSATLGGRPAHGRRGAGRSWPATPSRGRSSSTSRAKRPAISCAPRSATASTSCWPTRSRSPDRGRATHALVSAPAHGSRQVQVRGDRRRRAADHRHLSQARRNRRSRPPHGRLASAAR